MAFPDHEFVLLALPKTASTTLEQALSPYASMITSTTPGMKHLGAQGFERQIAPKLSAAGHPRESYEVVTMFRDPVGWLESWWRYRARDELARRGSRNSTASISFEDFALSYIAEDGRAPTPRGRPALFITIDGVVGVDRILAVDRPDVWQRYFVERLGRPLDFEQRNTSTAPVRGELSETVRASLRDYLAPEYDVWGRLSDTGQWAGARGAALSVSPRSDPRRRK